MIERLRELLARGVRFGLSIRGSRLGASTSVNDADLTTLQRAGAEADPADIGRLRRERRRFPKAREQSVRDLGGLTVEMIRRDAFKPELLQRRARAILALEDGVYDLEDALSDARHADPAVGSPTLCSCGSSNDDAPVFCTSCGRSLKQTTAVTSCAFCTAALPGGAQFCPSCGTATESTHESQTGAGW